jgi:Beta-lactamase
MRAELLAPTEMRETTFATGSGSTPRVAGHELTADGPVPVDPLTARRAGPAGTTAVSTVGDMLRFAGLHLDDPALATLRRGQPAPRIHGYLDGWCLGWASFDWDGDRVWGWDSVLPGERAVLRLVPEQRAAVVLMTNGDAGRAMYRSLFTVLMGSLFGISMPPLRLETDSAAAVDLSRYASVYTWPDRRVEVTAAAGSSLIIETEEGRAEALPVDERTFVVDPMDPDNPTVTFEAFDADGRPGVLYEMLWGLPRLSDGA